MTACMLQCYNMYALPPATINTIDLFLLLTDPFNIT